jgi:PKD repeat protein
LVVGALAIPAQRAEADADELIADWQMNEAPGATTMVDGSGNDMDGTVGSAVVTGYVAGGATGYHWSDTQPNQPPPKPERLVQVHDDRLNPGIGDYAVTVRFRTTETFGNIIQKGQSGAPGGNFKWQIPRGKLVCKFKGLDANGAVVSKSVNSGETLLNDGAWHVVRCERKGDKVIMTIDDTITRTGIGHTGNIVNTSPLTIGGKLNCDQVEITCDYFVGEVDYVKIEADTSPEPNDPPEAIGTGDCDFLVCDFDGSASFDPDGTIRRYYWTFGDGETAVGKRPTHTYAAPGTYEVKLTVTDDGGRIDSHTFSVTATTQPPTAAFLIDCTYRTCRFDASGSTDADGTIVSYVWSFGNGAVGNGVSPEYTYGAPGTYSVTLTVTDNHGASGQKTKSAIATSEPTVHLHALRSKPYGIAGPKWVARAVVKVRDPDGAPVEGVEIKARFGAKKNRICVTKANGNCRVKLKVADTRPKIPVEVVKVDWAGGYDPGANRDSDGDGNPERTLIRRP